MSGGAHPVSPADPEQPAIRPFQAMADRLVMGFVTSSIMKRFLPLLLAIALGFAQNAARAEDRATLVDRVDSCEAIIREFMAVPATAIPSGILKQAKGLLIVNQFKAGFIFGFKGGYGVVLVRKANGQWSIPVLVRTPEASFGLQAGADSVETVYVFMDERTPRLLFNERFHMGVDAKAVAGPHAADAEADTRPLISDPILVYTKSSGLFAGATVKAAQISRDDKANYVLYGTSYTIPELLYSDWVQPPKEVQPLMQFVQQIAP
jgi:lipid-binding SYLF domain-containing protein